MRPPSGPPGQIVLLNGTSSSGKTTVARHLLEILDRPWFHLAVDGFGRMRSPGTVRLSGAEVDAVLARTRAGFHRAVAGMAAAGNDVVMDHVLSEPWRLVDCLEVFDGLDVVFVGVHCSPAELDRRERARADRVLGQAAEQVDLVHAHGVYDLVVDTTTAAPAEVAGTIAAFLRDRPAGPTAFDRLRAGAGTTALRN